MKDKIISIIKGYECDAYFGANLNHLKEEDYDDVAKDIIKLFSIKHNVNVPDISVRSGQLACKHERIEHIDNFTDRMECLSCGKRF